MKSISKQAPSAGPTTLEVPLYPRSAQVLHDILEAASVDFRKHPQYVAIDVDNLRNQLRAHLQRIAQGT